VNTNGLAKHYAGLTPWERLPLILAASARGDEQERSRLAVSAPKVGYRVPDHFGLAMAFREVSEQHFMEVLNLTANYFQGLGMADGTPAGKRLEDVSFVLGYLLKVDLAGWRQFCAEHHFDPQLSWSLLPGFDTIQRAEKTAETAACTMEGVCGYLERSGRAVAQVRTAETVCASLRECLRARAEWWQA
jgi:hypothetical protein